MSKIAPITPQEAKAQIKAEFPDFVIEGVNNIIKKHYFSESFTVLQKDVMKEIMAVAPAGMTSSKIFENHWMDFEDLYRQSGWKVSYDSAVMESYEPNFTFTADKKK